MDIRKTKANHIMIMVVLAFAAGLSACASTPSAPPPPEPAPAPPALDPALVQALEDAKNEAAKQQKMAEDFGGPDYAADDYQQAQSLAAEARGLNPASDDDYRAATEKYKAVADAFRGAGEKAVPQFFDAKVQAVQEARAKAVEAGAGQEDVWQEGADQLASVDQDVTDGESLYNSKDYYGAAGAYDSALNRSGVVETEAQCYTLKAEIEGHNMQSYDPDTYAQGEDSLGKVLTAYNDKDFAAAKTAAEEALASYQTVADTGWEKLAAEQADAAKAQQDKAQGIKADVALKDDFEAAAAAYSQGEDAVEQKDFKQAYGDFSQALTMFTAVYDQVFQQRQAADALIKQADQRVSESGALLKNIQSQTTGSGSTGRR